MKRINRLLMQVEPRENQYLSIADLGEDGLWHTITQKWDGRPRSGYDRIEGIYESLEALEAAYPGEHVVIVDAVPGEPVKGEAASDQA